MADYDVGVLVSVTDNELDNLEKRINNLKNKTVKVNIEADSSSIKGIESLLKNAAKTQTFKMRADTSGIKKEVSSALKSINSISMKPTKLKVDAGEAKKEVVNLTKLGGSVSIKPMKFSVDTSSAQKSVKVLNAVVKNGKADIDEFKNEMRSFGFGNKEIDSMSNSLRNLNVEVKSVVAGFKDDHTFTIAVKGADKAKREIQSTITAKKQLDAVTEEEIWITSTSTKIGLFKDDTVKRTNEEYRKLLSTIKEIGSLNVKLQGLDESSADAKELMRQIDELALKANNLQTSIAKANGGVVPDRMQTGITDAWDASGRKIDLASAKASVKETESEYRNLLSTIKEIGSIRVQLQGLDEGSRQAEILTADIERLKTEATEIFSRNDFSSFGSGVDDAVNKIDSNLDKAKAKIIDAREEAAKGIELKVKDGKLDADFGQIKKKIIGLEGFSKNISSEYDDVILKARELESALASGDKDAVIRANEAYIASLDKLENKIERVSATKKKVDTQDKAIAAEQALRNKANNLSMTIDVWLKNNTKAGNALVSQLKRIQSELATCDATQFNNLQSQFKAVTTQAKLTEQTGLSLGDRLKAQVSKFGAYFGVSSVILSGTQAIRNMAQSVLEVDTAMTELRRVTDLTEVQYDNLYDNMITSAKEYGATLTDIINSTADWSRAGFDAETANGLAEVTMMYEHIADIDYDEATQNLLTSYKGFEGQLTDMFGDDAVASANYIADILNELDNNYAVTAAGIGEALRRSAASMDVANNSIEQTAALVGSAIEVTQDPEGAGNALKVVSMRLRGAKGELEEMGEEVDDNVENLTKMQGQILNLTHGNVNIFEDDGSFKSTYDILKDISDVWDNLSDIEQGDLLETIAGKHRANTVASILGNFDNAEKMYASALESTGSAAQENEKYMDSLQGRLNELTTTFQSFANTVLSSNFLKGIVDVGSGALNILDMLIDKLGLFPTILGTISAALTPKGFGGIFKVVEDEAVTSGHKIRSIFGNISELRGKKDTTPIFNDGFSSMLDKDIEAIERYKSEVESGKNAGDMFAMHMSDASLSAQEYVQNTKASALSTKEFTLNEKQKQVALAASDKSLSRCKSLIAAYGNDAARGGLSQKQFADSVKNGNAGLGKYLSNLNGARGSIAGYIASLVGAKAATIALQVASMALNAAITMGIGALISFGVSAISSWINSEKELAEKVGEVTSKYKEQQETIKNAKSLVDKVAPSDGSTSRYRELSQGVNELGQNISLTSDEYSEYQGIVSEIASMFPELVSGYDAEGNAILSCKNNVDLLTESYKKMAMEANNDLLKSADDISGSVKNNLNNLNENTKDYGDIPYEFGDRNGAGVAEAASSNSERMKALKKVLESGDLKSALDEYVQENSNVEQAIVKTLEHEGLKREENQTNRDFILTSLQDQNAKQKIQAVVSKYYDAVEEAISPLRDIVSAQLNNAFLDGSTDLSDSMQSIVTQVTNSISSEKLQSLNSEGGSDAITKYVDGIVDDFNRLKEAGKSDTIESAFNLTAKFDKGKLTVEEYKNQIDDVIKTLDELEASGAISSDTNAQIKLSLNVDEIQQDYDSLIDRLTSNGIDETVAKELTNKLNKTKFEAAVELVVSNDEDFQNSINKYTEATEKAEKLGIDTSDLGSLKEARNQVKQTKKEIDKLDIDMSKTVFGNIDTDNRQILDWTNDNLNIYKDALMSWAEDGQTWEQVKKSMQNSASTVMGTTESFDGIEIAFSPILQTKDGAKLLDKDTVNTYIDELIGSATKDGGTWSSKDLLKLDAEGMEIDGQKIKGLIADIGDTAKETSQNMHYVGETGALAMDEAYLDAVKARDAMLEAINHQAELNTAMNFGIDIDGATESLEKFNTALAESRTGTGLTLESFEALKSRYSDLKNYDEAKLFEETANGLKLNTTAVNEYESALAKSNVEESNKNIGVLKDEYDNLTNKIDGCTDATERANLINQQENIRQKINNLAELATMYEGLASSYNEWQNAEKAGNNRDMYQNVYSAQEDIKKELDNGWIDDGTREYFQLIWGEDKWDGAGKSVQDYRDKWATLGKTIKGTSYSVNDFFKTNKDGELTSEGIFNFFDAVKQKQDQLKKDGKFKGEEDWIKTDKNGNVKSFNFGVDGDKAVADALGISEELVQIFERAAQDCGFVVDFSGTYTQLADMQGEAQDATKKLKELGKTKFKFDFNTTDLSSLNKQLDEAKRILEDKSFWKKDGSFNFKAEGAEEAMKVASTLQATIDNLDNHYIGLTVEDKAFEEPLEKLQDYETKTAQINQLELDPKVNAKEIKELKGDLEDTVDYFYNLDDETKKKIGIEVDASKDDIKKQIDTGDIKIPTTLDIQTSMDDTLKDLRDLALLNSGLLDDDKEQIIKLKFKIDASEVDISNAKKKVEKAEEQIKSDSGGEKKLSSEGKERAIKFFAENDYTKEYDETQQLNVVKFVGDWSDIDNYKPKEKKAVVEFVKDIDDIESYRPEQRQAIVNFVKDVDDINSYKPEEKEAIAKFVANTDGVDSYEPEQKTAVAQFVKDSIDVDSYEPEDRKAIAEFVKDSKDVDSYTPDEKRAIAKYAVESGDVDNYSPEERSAIVNFLTNSADPDSYTPEQKTAIAKFLKESGEVDGYQPNQKQAIARFLKDSSEPDSYQPDPKTQNVTSKLNSSEVDNYNPPEKQMTIWATIKKKASDLWNKLTGGGGVDGTAHVNGTAYSNGSTGRAFAQGNWGTKEDGVALGGELGTELLVRNGRWYTIGDNGAEFFGYKKDDIIFNADQTKELFEKGKITHGNGRGKALASGTAFSKGTGSSRPTYNSSSSNKTSTSKTSKNKSKSSSSSSDKDTKEEFDWIEVKIDRIERAISRADKTFNNTFTGWKARAKALNKELSKTKDEITVQNKAYKRYIKEANKYGKSLSKSWKNRVKNGTIDISTIKNEKLAEKIKNYQTWYLIMPTCLVIDM